MVPGTSFIENLKLILKKPNYEIGWVHNWPMIISQIIDQWSFHSMPFTLQTMIFHYNNKLNDVFFYSPNSFYKIHLTTLKNSKLKGIV